jgi:hypothetical protein
MRLRALSFNIWSTPIVAPDVLERLDKFLTHVDDYDVVGFQEVFLHSEYLCNELAKRGFQFVLFTSGTGLPLGSSGSGCAIASRYPILSTCWRPFSCAGLFQRVDHSDAQAGKGIGHARILVPERGTVDVFVSHFVAQYSDINDLYGEQRILSAVEAAMFILAASTSPLTLFCVDLNANPDKLVYKVITSLTGMVDSFSYIKGNDLHEPTFGVDENVYSSRNVSSENEAHQNFIANIVLFVRSLFSSSSGSAPLQCDDNARLDYVFFWANPSSWQLTSSEIKFNKPFLLKNGKMASYSDHCAVDAVFSNVSVSESSQKKKRRKSETSESMIRSPSRPPRSLLELVEVKESLEKGLEKVTKKAELQRWISFLFSMLSISLLLFLTYSKMNAVNGITSGVTLVVSLVFILTGLMVSETALGLAFGFFLAFGLPGSCWLLFIVGDHLLASLLGMSSILLLFFSILSALIASLSSEGHKRSFLRGLEEIKILQIKHI